MKSKFVFLLFSSLVVNCAYRPTTDPPKEHQSSTLCQMRCSEDGMMVDSKNASCGCIQFPGK